MNRPDNALQEIVSLLGERFPQKAPITADMHISRDLGLDSLAAMDLLMSLEDRFDVSIPLNSLPEVETISDLAALIDNTRAGATRR
jgi:acyl carrier protein